MCGCQVEYSDGGGEYSDVIYVTLCAKHSGSAILDLVATNRIALTPEYEGQWHADLYLDREIPLAKVEGATPAEAVLALMSAERIDPEQESVEQAGGDRWDALQSIMEWTASENIPDERKLCLIRNAARAALAQPSPAIATAPTYQFHSREIGESDWAPCDFSRYLYCSKSPEMDTRVVEVTAQPSPAQAEQAEAERPALWAVHAQGPDELYAAFSREDAEKHAAELNTLPMPEGIAVGAVVVPSPWPAVQHWQYLAEQEQDHKNEIAGRLRQLERICEGLPQDAIDGGWTVQGIRGYAKRLEDQLKAALAQVEALRAELQSQRERNTELIFKLGSATNGWGRCEKERDAALARVAKMEACGAPALLAAADYFAERAKGPSPGWVTLSAVAKELRVRADKAPVAQAQHSVPEGWMLVPVEPLLNMMSDKDHDTRIMAERQLLSILADAPGKEVPQAWLDVQAERRRQVEAEGWTPKHDDEHADGQMAQAAGCYALHAGGIGTDWPDGRQNGSALFWPWDKDSWKPTTPRRDLVKACALALAEIERLDRAGISQSPQPGATTASS